MRREIAAMLAALVLFGCLPITAPASEPTNGRENAEVQLTDPENGKKTTASESAESTENSEQVDASEHSEIPGETDPAQPDPWQSDTMQPLTAVEQNQVLPAEKLQESPDSGEIYIDEAHFPDAAFRSFVRSYLDIDQTGTLSLEEYSISAIYLPAMGVKDLTGLSCFPELQILSCSGNQISVLDLTGVPKLETLFCSNNAIRMLQLPALPALTTLDVSGNPMETLELSGAPNLQSLTAEGGKLCALNLGSQPKLTQCKVTGQVREVSSFLVSGAGLQSGFQPDRVQINDSLPYDTAKDLFSFEGGGREIMYGYDCGNGQICSFTLRFTGTVPDFLEVPRREADCETTGKKTYFQGSDGKSYILENGRHYPVSSQELTIPALGHQWDKPVYTWAQDGSGCVGKVSCLRDSRHQATESAGIESRVTLEPNYQNWGQTTYKALFHQPWAAAYPAPEKVLTDLPPIPHTHTGVQKPGYDATEVKEGHKTYYCCSLCGKNFQDPECTQEIEILDSWIVIPKLSHVHRMTEVKQTEPDCTAPGIQGHWHCQGCGKDFGDPEGRQELSDLTILPLGHDWEETVYTWAKDGSKCTASHTCRRNQSHQETEQALITREETRQPTYEAWGESTYTAAFSQDWAKSQDPVTLVLEDIAPRVCDHSLQLHRQINPTETTDGKRAYYHCTRCGRYYEDVLASREIPDINSWGLLPKGHQMQYRAGKAPTCETDGIRTHWYCTLCQKSFADPKGKEPLADPRLPALGHDWEKEYTWNGSYCTARRTCRRNSSHSGEASTKALEFVTRQPTCTELGETTYLAVFREEWAGAQIKTCRDVPALGHDWEQPVYRWSEDGRTCEASRICRRDDSHQQQELADLPEEGDTVCFAADWAQQQISPGSLIPEETEAAFLSTGLNPAPDGIQLPAEVLSGLKTRGENGAEPLKLYSGMAEVFLQSTALDTILRDLGEEGILFLQVIRREKQDPSLNPAQQNALAAPTEGRLYELIISAEAEGRRKPITDLPDGAVQVCVPYALSRRESLRAYCLGKDGQLTEVLCSYDPQEALARFSAGGQGHYLLVTEKSPSVLPWVLAGTGILTVLGIAVFLIRRKKH